MVKHVTQTPEKSIVVMRKIFNFKP